MTRSPVGTLLVMVGLLPAALSGCGGGASSPPPSDGVSPAGTSIEMTGPEVEIFTAQDRIIVQGFRIDFPKTRNVTSLIGFKPEEWERVVTIPLADVQEFQIRGVIDSDTFDRIYKNREQYSVNQEEFFNTSVVARDGTRLDMVAVMPKFRGLKDGVVWDLSMAGNPARIDRIIIRH